MREILQDSLFELGRKHKNIVLLVDDSARWITDSNFVKFFADRYFNFGKGSLNMFSAAAGFVSGGKLPIVIGDVSLGYKQILDGIATPNLNIKLIGIEEETFIGRLPNMKICENLEAMLEEYGPAYMQV